MPHNNHNNHSKHRHPKTINEELAVKKIKMLAIYLTRTFDGYDEDVEPPEFYVYPRYDDEGVPIAFDITDLLIKLNPMPEDFKTSPLIMGANGIKFDFYVRMLVRQILSYCNRRDFPYPLIDVVVEVIIAFLEGVLAAAQIKEEDLAGNGGIVSEIKLGDSTFKFDTTIKNALANLDLSKLASQEVFNLLKPQLNSFRRLKAY